MTVSLVLAGLRSDNKRSAGTRSQLRHGAVQGGLGVLPSTSRLPLPPQEREAILQDGSHLALLAKTMKGAHLVLFVTGTAYQTSPRQYFRPLLVWSGSAFGTGRDPHLSDSLRKHTGTIRLCDIGLARWYDRQSGSARVDYTYLQKVKERKREYRNPLQTLFHCVMLKHWEGQQL